MELANFGNPIKFSTDEFGLPTAQSSRPVLQPRSFKVPLESALIDHQAMCRLDTQIRVGMLRKGTLTDQHGMDLCTTRFVCTVRLIEDLDGQVDHAKTPGDLIIYQTVLPWPTAFFPGLLTEHSSVLQCCSGDGKFIKNLLYS